MGYQAQFPTVVPFSSIQQVISDIRSGNVDAKTFAEIAWIAGCAATVLGGGVPRFGTSENPELPSTVDGILNRLENCMQVDEMKPEIATAMGWTPNPENVKLILQLLIQLLPLILK